jgi:hypothetical protein
VAARFEGAAVIPIVLHMRNGDTIAYSPTNDELKQFTALVDDLGFGGVLTINDASGQRLINLTAVDWVEVKGKPA